MKKLFTICAIALATLTVFAQVPQGISYQAIAFNAGGTPVVNSNVSVRISILDNSATGTVVYMETHAKTTNAQGLFNLNIGQGSALFGTFPGISWATNSKFLKVEVDPAGGTNYTASGTNQLMSVPFALMAASVTGGSSGGNISDQLLDAKFSNVGFIDGYGNKAYVFNAATGTWTSQSFDPNSNPALKAVNGNFYFDDSYGSKVYVFSGKTGQWSSQAYNGNSNVTVLLDTLSGNFAFDDGYDSKVYAYNVKTGVWAAQAYNGNSNVTLKLSKGNVAFDDGYDSKVYVYNSKSGTWSSQAYNGNSNITIVAAAGSFFFNDGYDSKVYAFNAITGTWSNQSYDPNSNPTLLQSEGN